MVTFADLVAAELAKARKSGKNYANWYQVYGMLEEEVDEFWEEVRKKSSKRDKLNALLELYQITTICQKAAEDLASYYDMPGQMFKHLDERYRTFTSWHEVSAVLKEDMEFIWEAVKGNESNIIPGLIDLCTSCQYAAYDLGLMDAYNQNNDKLGAMMDMSKQLNDVFKDVCKDEITGKDRRKQSK